MKTKLNKKSKVEVIEDSKPKQYVVLEHLNLPSKGRRFWTTNRENNTHSGLQLWYKEILFTDSESEATEESSKHGELATINELTEYYRSKMSIVV